MGILKAFHDAFKNLRKEKSLKSITENGLDMEALQQIATLHEKYIEVVLKDGTMIKIWRESDRVDFKPDPRIW